MLSMEAVLLMCCGPLLLNESADDGFLLFLRECSLIEDQLLLASTPVSESELSPLGLTGLRLLVLDGYLLLQRTLTLACKSVADSKPNML